MTNLDIEQIKGVLFDLDGVLYVGNQMVLITISETGTTILIVEHDMGLVRSLCEEAVVLNFGRKIYEGSTRRVQDDPQVLEAYLGSRHVKDHVVAGGADA